jgi:hypothetical protein
MRAYCDHLETPKEPKILKDKNETEKKMGVDLLAQ